MRVQHKLGFRRLFSILLSPNFIVLIFVVLAIFEPNNKSRWYGSLTVSILFYLPYLFIIRNHWKYADGVALVYDKKQVTIKKADTVQSFHYDEITKITEYTGGGKAGIDFRWWCFHVGDAKFPVSFLTMSALDFEKMFFDKITEVKQVRWPSIKPDIC